MKSHCIGTVSVACLMYAYNANAKITQSIYNVIVRATFALYNKNTFLVKPLTISVAITQHHNMISVGRMPAI